MINKDKIVSVYSGRPGCACGCRGNHSKTKRAITTVVNKMNRLDPDIKQVGNHYAIETRTRLYIAYWTDKIVR